MSAATERVVALMPPEEKAQLAEIEAELKHRRPELEALLDAALAAVEVTRQHLSGSRSERAAS